MNIIITNQETFDLENWMCEEITGVLIESTREYSLKIMKSVSKKAMGEDSYSLTLYSAVNTWFRNCKCVDFELEFRSLDNPSGSYCYEISDSDEGREIIELLKDKFTI
jgi:hypothetical protein